MKRVRRLSALEQLAVLAVLALLAWLDSDGCAFALRPGVPLHTAGLFSAILTGIEIIGGWLGTGAAAAAGYLATALQWVAGRLTTFIKATGAVFAKSWDALKIVYADVLKPAVQWFDAHLKRLYSWLRDTFKPAFDFLYRVRQELLDLYRRFLRPILSIIDSVRAGLRVLGDLGIEWARALDRRLGEFESLITENFNKILHAVNEAIDVLNIVVDGNRLFQRFTFLRTVERDTTFIWRAMVNPGVRPLNDLESATLGRAVFTASANDTIAALGQYLDGQSNDVGDVIDAIAGEQQKYLESLA